MSRRGARLTVAVLFALVCGAAAWQYARVERSVSGQADAAASFEREARSLATAVAELRGAQQGYVADGQGPDYWTTRVTKDLASLRTRVESLRRQAADARAVAHVNAASSALERFARTDARARDYLGTDHRLLASDLIYNDGFELARTASDEIEAAREAEGIFGQAIISRLRMQQQLLAGGIAGLGLLFLLILAFTPAEDRRVERQATSTRVLDLDQNRPPTVEHPAPDTEQALLALDESFPLTITPAAPVVDLRAAAELCLDLARVTDPEEIPALLRRVTHVLDARGIVLWMADPDGRELVPTVAHGYAASSLARLGTIHRDSDNATAAAFRESRVHIVKGDTLTNGAIVVPLVTAGGCIGVMAAELRNEREQREEVRAVASMMAAQLAALVGVAPPAQPQAKAN